MKRYALLAASTALCLALVGCGNAGQEASSTSDAGTSESTATASATASEEATQADNSTAQPTSTAITNLPGIDNAAWLYNADDDVYYQVGISYCETPADGACETLAVFVPGVYMDAADNGDGTFTCTVNESAAVGSYTAQTAPIVMPINTPGYSAQAALDGYTSVADYTNAGFVYVHAGCRGRDAGAPAGVTDLKAAIRYLRYTNADVAGSAESIFMFGMSGGGAQSALVGATGDSSLYDAYLEQIGAVQGVSNAVAGSMNWCPITSLETADEAYEWMMGNTRTGLSDDEQAISDALTTAFATYMNSAGFVDENGNTLTLEESAEGIYQAGTYYDYMKGVIEESLNNFLADTTFPYDASASASGGMGGPGGADGFGGGEMGGRGDFGGAPDGNGSDGDFVGGPDGNGPDGGTNNGNSSDGANKTADQETSFEDMDNIQRTGASDSGLSLSGTYKTAQDYIDALNANSEWVSYDASTNTATITSIADFTQALKNASKSLGAFDQLDAGQGENTLFGYGDGSGAHFDATLAAILEDLGSEYASDYAADLAKTDAVGNTVDVRLNAYSPLYYLMESSEGYGSSTPAKYWRIRTGINQGDCALSTEVNLALALQAYSGVESVDFETVWGQGHTQAERTGTSAENFIAWVQECTA